MSKSPQPSLPAQKSGRSHFRRLGTLIAVLVFESLLLLSDQLHWFTYKDNSRLTALLGCAGVAALCIPSALRIGSKIVRSIWLGIASFFRTRRWYQFSLRSLLVFTLIFAIVVGWLGKKIVQKRREQQAIEAIARAGGQVWYDHERPNFPTRQDRMPSGPRWVRSFLGDNFLSAVKQVDLQSGDDATLAQLGALPEVEALELHGSKITDAGMVHIKTLSQLRTLAIRETNVTNQWLVNLKDFRQLRILSLGGTNFGDAGMEQLKALPQLEQLVLLDTNVTDAGLESVGKMTHLQNLTIRKAPINGRGLVHLKSLSNLEYLCLMETKVTDGGLVGLNELTGLQKLWLDRNNITDVGLVNLKRLTQLEWLFLDDTGTTDAGLVNLKELSHLTNLMLCNTQVTDAGLSNLEQLKRLEFVELVGTAVTANAVDDLQRVLPDCGVAIGKLNSVIMRPPASRGAAKILGRPAN
jgi:Leucine-rich repeat (LRR) protein